MLEGLGFTMQRPNPALDVEWDYVYRDSKQTMVYRDDPPSQRIEKLRAAGALKAVAARPSRRFTHFARSDNTST